ncbi:MAG: hypothetical protein AVDCRST_MAG78-1648 [uncultured Rubrobacteraceae bacterium]|uniref:Uncharacterized protein n=1 Tax=uncultured Rubrobacteraceae bacterium TaxID=349277 RepID=A0A6J4PZZ4_9ACTN|nr:MAG: hypothetical protein AVDCRST_MAG78-1648 [uncultured Rubrobacteraceae bacterium]
MVSLLLLSRLSNVQARAFAAPSNLPGGAVLTYDERSTREGFKQ